MNEAVLAKVREVCQAYLNPDRLRSIAEEAVDNASKKSSCEAKMQALQSKITALTTNLDQMYMDRLNGLLSEENFQRIYQKIKMDRRVMPVKPAEPQTSKAITEFDNFHIAVLSCTCNKENEQKIRIKKVTKSVTHLLFLRDKCVFLYLFQRSIFLKKERNQ